MWKCGLCGAILDSACPDGCPECGAPCVGWLDEAGGWHEGGCGNMPDGTFCGECNRMECGICEVWNRRQAQLRAYGDWQCEECGSVLEIWLDEVEEERPAEGDGFRYERRHLMWHCPECGCDYENHWETQWGDTSISMIKRKYWG